MTTNMSQINNQRQTFLLMQNRNLFRNSVYSVYSLFKFWQIVVQIMCALKALYLSLWGALTYH